LRLAELKGNAGPALETEARLRGTRGVLSATANPVTGSLLILYEPSVLTFDCLRALLPEYPDFSLAAAPSPRLLRRTRPTVCPHCGARKATLKAKFAKTVLGMIAQAAVERAAFALVAAVL
jgi:hypothetical protein